jgi:hypothetical protein
MYRVPLAWRPVDSGILTIGRPSTFEERHAGYSGLRFNGVQTCVTRAGASSRPATERQARPASLSDPFARQDSRPKRRSESGGRHENSLGFGNIMATASEGGRILLKKRSNLGWRREPALDAAIRLLDGDAPAFARGEIREAAGKEG